MSLVGTRPILPDELEQYELHHRARIAIKPGITGMWQVSGRSDITDFEEIVRLDMISFTRIEIESLDSYENLKTAVPTRLIDDEVIKVLKRYLGERCDEIQIEYPYYDILGGGGRMIVS